MKLLIIDSLYSSKLKVYNNEIESLTTNEDRISYLNNSFSSSSSGYLEAFQNYGFTTSNTFVNVMNLSGDLNKKNYIFNNIVWEKNNYLVRLEIGRAHV